MRHLIEPADFTDAETAAVLDLADRIGADPAPYAHAAEGRRLATLFYEPSTRTRLSFESAMLRLGAGPWASRGRNSPAPPRGRRWPIPPGW